MKVGKLLKEKAGFDNPETVTKFINRFGYSEVIFNKILNDQFPVLLACHIEDLSLFTGFSVTELMEAQELTTHIDKLRMHVPMGKPYVAEPPVAGIIDVRAEIPSLQNLIDKRYGGCTKLEQEEDLPVHNVSVLSGRQGAQYLLAAMGEDRPMLTNQHGEEITLSGSGLIPSPISFDDSEDLTIRNEGVGDKLTMGNALTSTCRKLEGDSEPKEVECLFSSKSLINRLPGIDMETVKMFLDSSIDMDQDKLNALLDVMHDYFYQSPAFKELVKGLAEKYHIQIELVKKGDSHE